MSCAVAANNVAQDRHIGPEVIVEVAVVAIEGVAWLRLRECRMILCLHAGIWMVYVRHVSDLVPASSSRSWKFVQGDVIEQHPSRIPALCNFEPSLTATSGDSMEHTKLHDMVNKESLWCHGIGIDSSNLCSDTLA
jgi:hypothetical protein